MNHCVTIEPDKLCSRKLWQLLSADPCAALEPEQQDRVVRELLQRRHYLAELRNIGKLEQSN